MIAEKIIKNIVKGIERFLDYRKSLRSDVRTTIDVILLFVGMIIGFTFIALFANFIHLIEGNKEKHELTIFESEKKETYSKENKISSWVNDVKNLFKSSSEQDEELFQTMSAECKNAALEQNYTEAHKLLNKLAQYSDKYGLKERYKKVYDYVFNAEAKYLCAIADIESINRLSFLLSDIPIRGYAIPEGTDYVSDSDFDYEKREAHSDYIEYVTDFNQKCDDLIDLAISNHNYAIIEKVLPLYKSLPNPLNGYIEARAEDKNYKIRYSTKYRVQKVEYSDLAKKNATAKVNKAIRDGVFSNINKEY